MRRAFFQMAKTMNDFDKCTRFLGSFGITFVVEEFSERTMIYIATDQDRVITNRVKAFVEFKFTPEGDFCDLGIF